MLSIKDSKFKHSEYASLTGECFFSANPFCVPGTLPLYVHSPILQGFNIKLRKDLFPNLFSNLGISSSIDSNYFNVYGAVDRFLAPHQNSINVLQDSAGLISHNHSGTLNSASFTDGHTLNRNVFTAGGSGLIGWGTGTNTTIYVESSKQMFTNSGEGNHGHMVSFYNAGASENAPPFITVPLFIHTGEKSDTACLIVPSGINISGNPQTFNLDSTSLGNFNTNAGPTYSVFDCTAFCAQYNIHSFVAKFPNCNGTTQTLMTNVELIKNQIIELQKKYKYVYVMGLTEGALMAAHAVNGLVSDVTGLITINGIFNLPALTPTWLTGGIHNALGTNYASLLNSYSVQTVKCPLLTMSLCSAIQTVNMDDQSNYISSNNLTRVTINGQTSGNVTPYVYSNTTSVLNNFGLFQPKLCYKFLSDYSSNNIPSSILKFMNLLI